MEHAGEILINALIPPLTFAVIGFVALGLGAFLIQPFYRRKHPPVVETFALGALGISLLTQLWGALHWLGPSARWSLGFLLLLLAVIGWISPRVDLPFKIRSLRNRTILVLSILLAVGVVFKVFLFALYPPSSPEECSTYLPTALNILRDGRLAFNPGIDFNTLPQNTEMLYLWAVAVSPLSSAHYVNVLAFIASLLAMIRLGRAAFSVKTGWLAALLLGIISAVQTLGYHSYPDLWVMFYLLAALLTGTEAYREGAPGRLLLAGIFMGAAAGSGYIGLIGAATLAISLTALSRWRMPDVKAMQREDIFASILLAVLVASPWYIRNIVWFHNPVFPFMSNFFHPGGGVHGTFGPESAIDLQSMMRPSALLSFYESGALWEKILKLWPIWGAIPAGIWFIKSSPFMRVVVTWTVLTWGYWLIFGGGIVHLSFYIYLIPVTAIAIAHLSKLIYILPAGDRKGRFFRVILWITLIGWVGILTTKDENVAPPLTTESRQEFLKTQLVSYDLIMTANKVIHKTDIAVGVLCGDSRLYAEFPLLGGSDVGLVNHRVIAENSWSPARLAALLQNRYNAKFLIVNMERLNAMSSVEFDQIKDVINSPEFLTVFHELAHSHSGVVYYFAKPTEFKPLLNPEFIDPNPSPTTDPLILPDQSQQ
jgi:hypothetical protein